MKISHGRCPVCGYAGFDPLDDHGYTTYEICPCCGCQSGYTYDAEVADDHISEVRHHWFVVKDGHWWSKSQLPPQGWNAESQLSSAGIAIPKK